MNSEYAHLLQLNVIDRMQLVEDLWISIAAEQREIPVADELLDELDRRKARFLAKPTTGMTLEEALRRIQGNLHG